MGWCAADSLAGLGTLAAGVHCGCRSGPEPTAGLSNRWDQSAVLTPGVLAPARVGHRWPTPSPPCWAEIKGPASLAQDQHSPTLPPKPLR